MVKKGGNQRAKSTARGLRQGTAKKQHTKRTEVTFKRPDTLKLPRTPAYPKYSLPKSKGLDKFAIMLQPLATERAMKCIEDQNTLVFLTDTRATKKQIAKAAENLYQVKVEKVNTLIRPDARKKAFIKLTSEFEALDVAYKIGIL